MYLNGYKSESDRKRVNKINQLPGLNKYYRSGNPAIKS